MSRTLNLAAFVERSQVNGPGTRAVVWVQGCPRVPICPGCYNPGLLDMGRRAELLPVEHLAQRIFALGGLDGVTFSGGEPFAQAEALAELAAAVRARGLNVAVFTGLTLEELRARPEAAALLAQTDLLIDGPYDRQQPSSLALRSSANQRLHFLSGRIRPEEVSDASDAVEVSIEGGTLQATGLVDGELLRQLKA